MVGQRTSTKLVLMWLIVSLANYILDKKRKNSRSAENRVAKHSSISCYVYNVLFKNWDIALIRELLGRRWKLKTHFAKKSKSEINLKGVLFCTLKLIATFGKRNNFQNRTGGVKENFIFVVYRDFLSNWIVQRQKWKLREGGFILFKCVLSRPGMRSSLVA